MYLIAVSSCICHTIVSDGQIAIKTSAQQSEPYFAFNIQYHVLYWSYVLLCAKIEGNQLIITYHGNHVGCPAIQRLPNKPVL